MMEPVVPPVAVDAFDTPDDDGGSITLIWPKDARANENTTYLITIAESGSGPFRVAAEVSAAGPARPRTVDPGLGHSGSGFRDPR